MRKIKKKSRYKNGNAILPSNYLELFFDTIKQNWQRIILMGIMLFIFFLPTLVCLFISDYYFLQLSTSTSYSQAEIDALRITSRNLFDIGICVGIIISSFGISGLSRVNLLVAREEGLFFFKDLNKGIRQNLKSNILFFTIYAVLLYCSLLVINNVNSAYLKFIPLAVVQTIFFPALLVNIETTSIYAWKIKDSFRNAFIIYIKNFFVVIIFALLYTAIILFNLIPYIFLKYVLIGITIILVYPFINLALRVYFNKILDRDINKDNYPEIYKRGIYEKESDPTMETSIKKYYGPTSNFNSIKHDPYLDTYFDHLCSYVTEKEYEKLLTEQLDVWPKEDILISLNYLRYLSYEHQTTFLNKRDYSALGLLQKEKSKVAIVLAGGGYSNVCVLPEGLPVCVELHKKGFAVFSVTYPLKEKAKESVYILKTFIKLLINKQNQMNIDMNEYIVIGFSAGAHLAGLLGTDNFGLQNDNIELPKLIGLCYPVITMKDEYEQGTRRTLLGNDPTEEDINDYSIEQHVDNNYPNVYIWHCERDNVVPYSNSLKFVDALKENNIDYIFEHFDDERHGLALGNNTPAQGWVDRLCDYYFSIIKK